MTSGRASSSACPAAPWALSAPPAGFHDDPYPHYLALGGGAPLVRARDGALLLLRHADVSAVYRDGAAFSSDKRVEFAAKFSRSPLFEHHTTSLVFNDDPYHGRVRRMLVGALSPRALAKLADGVETFCRGRIAELGYAGRCDGVADFAAAVPVRVIGDMFDVDDGERGALRGWSLAILKALEPSPDDDALTCGNRAVTEFSAFLERLIAERRRRPGDPERDLLTRMIGQGGDGEALSGRELVHNAIFLLNAGHETTTNLIGNALHILATRPALRRQIAADRALVPAFIEEVLRFESPNQLGNRRAVRDTAIAGIPVEEGTLITLLIGAANRDPAAFDEPDRFRLDRRPNRHLAFGAGGHQCAGLSLARLEGVSALSAWLEQMPDFHLEGPALWQRRVRFRGLEHLPLVWPTR